MAFADTAPLVAILKLTDQFTGPLKNAQRELGKFDAKLDKSATRAYRAGQQIGTGIKNGLALIAKATVTAGAGLAALSVISLKLAGDFEAQLKTINTVARASPEALRGIGDSIRKIARDTGTTTADLTAGYYDLVSAGIKASDATKVLVAANTLAIGGLSSTAEAVDLLTTAINTYGGDAANAGRFTDVFAKAIERGKVTAADLAASFAQVGPIAAASGIAIEELGAAYARLTASGVPAAEAATQVRSAIVALTKGTPALEALEKATKKNYLAIAGSQGLVVGLQQMRTDGEKANIPLIDLLGRVEGLNFTLATTGPNLAAYNADLAAMGKAAGTAAAQMAERQQGLNFQLARLKALAKDAGITIGTALLPKITPLVEKLNAFISGRQGDISAFGDRIASLFSDANIAEGSRLLTSMFKTAKEVAPIIAQSAKLTGEVIGKAVELFRSLPPEIQKLAVAGLAINKLTGGLVTNIAGGLISAVLKQLVSGVVNVSGAVVNVVGGPGIPGGPGTGLKDVIKTVALIAPPVLIKESGLLAEIKHGFNELIFGKERADAIFLAEMKFGQPGSATQAAAAAVAAKAAARAMGPVTSVPFGPATTLPGTALGAFAGALTGAARATKDYAAAAILAGRSINELRAAEAAARGSQTRIGFVARGKPSDTLPVADYLVRQFTVSQAPFYRNMDNAKRALEAIKADQRRAIRQGDTVTAAKLSTRIRELEAVIKRSKTTVNITIPVHTVINGRIIASAMTRFTSTVGNLGLAMGGGGSGGMGGS